MKRKYTTTQILPACEAGPSVIRKDIHAELEETIAERKKILTEWEKLFLPKPAERKKDIRAELEETVAEHKKIMQQWKNFFTPERKEAHVMPGKKAA